MEEGRLYITMRHNTIRDATAELFAEVCKDAKTEMMFAKLDWGVCQQQKSIRGGETRCQRTRLLVRKFFLY